MFKKIADFFKKLFKKVDNFREDLENHLADFLEKLDNSEDLDKAEEELITEGIHYACKYFGVDVLKEDTVKTIAEEVVKCLGKINNKVQDQLRK